VKSGLRDLSISRTTFDWGVKVPGDPEHVMYVWVDALTNYITGVGFPDESDANWRYWPADVHIIGKDIIRFHAVYWPAMLMAAGLEPPRHVAAHGWLLVGGEKMSKSKLTGIAPNDITDTFGSDAFRYYFLRAITFGSDGSFSWEDLAARYQGELANGFGNLASRAIAMVTKYYDGVVPDPREIMEADQQIIDTAATATRLADHAIERFAIHEAIASIWTLVDALNLYITEQAPWKLAKDEADAERLATVLYTVIEGLRVLAVLLSPITPKATAKLWTALALETPLGALSDQLLETAGQWGVVPAGTTLQPIEVLFPRIELES
jgi:methionyl-tRNA synthetase